ncbi:MAG TPA: hypothetical protein VH419_10665 [Nocardioidaceae bacterium]|jgi:hypothetical protein
MSDEPVPIAYTALQPGTPVQTSDGHEFGSVESVLAVEEVAVFDGIVVACEKGTRFVDADYVGAIFTTHVVTTLSAEEAAHLPLPDQDPVYDTDASDDTGASLSDRLGRMFGRGKWKRER